MSTNLDKRFHPIQSINQKRSVCQWNHDLHQKVTKVYSRLKTYGVHSVNRLRTSGFVYTGDNDTARCDICKLEVSGWTQDMDPYIVHRERSPNCSFVRSVQSENKLRQYDEENVAKRQKTELTITPCNQQNKLTESSILQEIRQRTFSHWGQKVTPSKEQMIAAGFFHCNVGDRVLCLYCNLITQQWNGETDDPVEVHKVLSPNCPYVLSMLIDNTSSTVFIVNEMPTSSNGGAAALLNNANRINFDQIVYTSACHMPLFPIDKQLLKVGLMNQHLLLMLSYEQDSFIVLRKMWSPASIAAGHYRTGVETITR
jgi:hypothetical protein